MQSRFSILLLMMFTMGFVGCGSSNDDASSLQSISWTNDRQPLLVILGGWNSCKFNMTDYRRSPKGMAIYDQFKHLLASFRSRGLQARYIIACHTTRSRLLMYSSTYPDTLLEPQNVSSLASEIRREQRLAGGPVVMVGHSHGGWLAMRLLTHLPTHIPILKLNTIDPISRNLCSPSTLLGIYESKYDASDWQVTNPDCLRSPADFSLSEKRLIRSRVQQWVNDYQEQGEYLHSSSVPEAHVNTLYRFKEASWFGYRAHIDIARQRSIWKRLNHFLFSTSP